MNKSALLSVVVCAVLVCAGLVRLASYSLGALGDAVRGSFVWFLAYDPGNRFNAQFFKLLATPSVVAGIYFLFRWRNVGCTGYRRIDFKPPLLRLILTSLATVHWLAMEWWKFGVEGFYPWSPLESRAVNVAVLLAGQAIAFFAMAYLSFAPLRIHGLNSPDDGG